jgi:hypothetical protein
MQCSVDAVLGVYNTRCMEYLVYAVLTVYSTRCMQYSLYTLLGVYSTQCMLYSLSTHDHGMQRLRGWLNFMCSGDGRVEDKKESNEMRYETIMRNWALRKFLLRVK